MTASTLKWQQWMRSPAIPATRVPKRDEHSFAVVRRRTYARRWTRCVMRLRWSPCRLRGVRRLRASLAGHNAYACDVRAATLLELASAPAGAAIIATDCGRGSADRLAAEDSLPHRFFVRAPGQVRLERCRWDIG